VLPTVWLETAITDVEQIVSYIAARNPAAAGRIRDLIVDTARTLGDHPHAYRAGRVSGTREVIVHPNYVLIYRVGLDAVTITNVFHSARQYPSA
jgi:toxin ParE1/3/4